MSRQSDTHHDQAASQGVRLALFSAGAAAVALFAGALALWSQNGLVVFMERLASGIVNCF